MKFYVNYVVPLILTFGLCLLSLNANANTTKQENSNILSALSITPSSPDSYAGFLKLNEQVTFSNFSNSHFSPSPTSVDFNYQPQSSQNFTVNAAIPIADFNLANQPAGQNFRTELNFVNEITKLKFNNEINTSETFERVQIITSPVPEPSEFVLFASGLVFLLFFAKRRKLDFGFTGA